MARRSIKILTSPTLSGLSGDIETNLNNGYNLITNTAPTITGNTEDSLAWVCTVETGDFSYNSLGDIPTFEGITLSGAMTYDSLSIQPSGDYATNTNLNTKLAPSNLIAGDNIVLTVSGLDVTIKSFAPENYVSTSTFLSAVSTIEGDISSLSMDLSSNYVLNSTFSSSVSTIEGDISILETGVSNLSSNSIPYTGATSDVNFGSNILYTNVISNTLTLSSRTAIIQDLYIMNEDNIHYHQIRIRTDGLDNNFVIGAPITL